MRSLLGENTEVIAVVGLWASGISPLEAFEPKGELRAKEKAARNMRTTFLGTKSNNDGKYSPPAPDEV